MASASSWRGAGQALPGGFCVRRLLSLNIDGVWTEVNIREATWAPKSPWLVGNPEGQQAADAATSAVLRRAYFRLVSGTALLISEEADPEDTRYSSADSSSPVFILEAPPNGERTGWWWATNGAIVIEVEVWFDVPVGN